MLNLNVGGWNRRAAAQPQIRLPDRPHAVSRTSPGLRADGEDRAGVGADRHADIAENFPDLIELLQIDHRCGRGRRIHGDIAAAALRDQRNAQAP